MKYEFAVIILNYKTPAMTISCAESVLADIAKDQARIVIVDNDSNDGSVAQISSWLEHHSAKEKIHLVASTTNTGFSGGNNQGMRAVDAEYYILLNSDTLVRTGALRTLLNTFSTEDRIGLVSPRLEDEDGTGQESCFRFHSPISEFIKMANTGPITKLLNCFNVPLPLRNEISSPQWTSFACVALRGTMIQEIGYMDDHYFLYYEDADYCRVAHNHGWKTINNPAAHVVHFRGGSAELKKKARLKLRLPTYHYDSRSYYFRKHYGQMGLFAANLLWTMGRLISKTRETIERSPKAASQMQWLDIWTRGRLFADKN